MPRLPFFCHRYTATTCNTTKHIARPLIEYIDAMHVCRMRVPGWHSILIWMCVVRLAQQIHIPSLSISVARWTDLTRFSASDETIVIVCLVSVIVCYLFHSHFYLKENKFICNILLLRTCQNGNALATECGFASLSELFAQMKIWIFSLFSTFHCVTPNPW